MIICEDDNGESCLQLSLRYNGHCEFCKSNYFLKDGACENKG